MVALSGRLMRLAGGSSIFSEALGWDGVGSGTLQWRCVRMGVRDAAVERNEREVDWRLVGLEM
jgi:hypothetical protein